ncbi:MAG: hypothetical protein IPG08_05650 [Sphingobacteriaceae bacterium]|nr:hypothetical protein [Sphingobacteriaceae bacterium]
MKNNTTKTTTYNLLESEDFKTALQFEATTATLIKGGHLPLLYKQKTRRRIIDPVNLLNEDEKQ